MTPLDEALGAMRADPEADRLRRAYFDRLSLVELFLLLDAEPDDESVKPRVFELDDGPVVLAFDTEQRLTDFAGASFYLGLPGAELIELVASSRLGLGINFGTDGAEVMMAPEDAAWLSARLAGQTQELTGPLSRLERPAASDELIAALDARLATAGGVLSEAVLVGTAEASGTQGLVLVLVDIGDADAAKLSRSIAQALAVLGQDVRLDVTGLAHGDPRLAKIRQLGLAFAVPEPPTQATPEAPGMDPAKPPKLL